MPNRVPIWARPGRASGDEPFTWVSLVLRLVGLPATALLWWALAFLPWKQAGSTSLYDSWPPTLPVYFTDVEVAIFGAAGAALVVVGLLRWWGMAALSVLLGYVVALVVTLTRGANASGILPVTTERWFMLAVSAGAAFVGLAIGGVAIGSLRRFGLLGLFAVTPVVSLIAVLFLGARADPQWLTRIALVVLLVLIAWQHWSGVLLWPLFFVLFWLLNLVVSAVGHGAQTLRRPWDGSESPSSATDASVDFARLAWRVTLGESWGTIWPAAIFAALVVAGFYAWRRTGGVPA